MVRYLIIDNPVSFYIGFGAAANAAPKTLAGFASGRMVRPLNSADGQSDPTASYLGGYIA